MFVADVKMFPKEWEYGIQYRPVYRWMSETEISRDKEVENNWSFLPELATDCYYEDKKHLIFVQKEMEVIDGEGLLLLTFSFLYWKFVSQLARKYCAGISDYWLTYKAITL